ncbi:MAG: NAD-dependent succinate-semialdehyde dehydrogenase [Acidobacteriota bacterium]|nr:MAG: NAD-dependent succinate-semialdehyde dehydrogenase [Acidobacteriota bacterium]
MPIQSVNPATGELIERFEELDDRALERALDRSVSAFEAQRATSFTDRASKMNAAARILEDERIAWARIATEEMGKTLKSAVAEIEKCAWVCRYYAENAERFLADEPIETAASRSFVRHLPLGPVLAVMPWNFPYWQVFRFAAPALMAGNTGLLKHASNVPRSALAIEDIFARAGFGEGCFTTLLIGSRRVERVLQEDRVRAVTLTGSEGAGRAVGRGAGDQIKHSVLELGGSDPFIVMPSADLDSAVEAAVMARTINNGQSCIAAKRFIVHERIYEAFTERFVTAFESLKVGDPMEESTDIGPLATEQIRDELDQQIHRTIDKGARRLTGAEPLAGPGYFYRPGILAEIPEDTPAFSEEVFGPVALLFRVRDLTDAIRIGNATRFGLGSAIWTTDEGEIERAFNELDAGATFVNTIVASDPRLPFGGVKKSGYGRELSRDGIREFVNRKTIVVA